MNGAGGGVHGIVDHRKRPRGGAPRIVLRRYFHFQLAVGAETPDGRQVLLGDAEVHKNRGECMDRHQRHVVRLHQIARVHQQVPGAPRDGRVDLAITQVELGPVHRRQVAGQRRARAFDAGLGGPRGCMRDLGIGPRLVGLRARSQPSLLQLGLQGGVGVRVLRLRRVARQRRFGLGDLRAVSHDAGFRLAERLLIRPRVDGEQQIALGDVLPFREAGANQLAGDLRFHLHDGGCLHRPHHPQLGGNGLLGGLGHRYGHHWRPARGPRLLATATAERKQACTQN